MTAPVVTVRGQAELTTPPDRATIWVTVHAQARSADQVRSALATGSQRVAATIDAHAAAVESSATTGIQVSPVFARGTRPSVTGYRGSFGSTVVVVDLDGLGALLSALVAIPEAEVGGPSWSLRTDHPAHAEARRAAIADGRRRADDYAAAFGATVTGLLEISDLDEGRGFGMPMRAMVARDSAEAAFEIEPAEQTVTGQVTLRFTLSEPDLG